MREYAEKWFAADTDLTSSEQKQKAEAFLEESEVVPDLRSNPLMLALMCNIYRGENYIPSNRPQVYGKCAEMLFERWDKSRGIRVPLPFEAHIRPAMGYLAHWIYTSGTLQEGVTEARLVSKAADYLLERRFEDHDEAESAAREFISFCSGRAWVFTDTGTTKEGEKLYQFTHRTFLEYFTAAYLVRRYETADELEGFIRPKIARQEWDVVAQLTFQIKDRDSEGAGDKLLTSIVDKAREAESQEGWNLLSFAARCLEFIVPKPKVSREISRDCVERCLTWSAVRVDQKPPEGSELRLSLETEPEELLGNLLSAKSENRKAIADSIENLLVHRINDGSEQDSLSAIEIGLYLYLFLRYHPEERQPSQETLSFWRNVSERILNSCSERIENLHPKHYRVGYDAFLRGKISLTDFIRWHGIEALFRSRTYVALSNIRSSSVAETLINTVLRTPYLSERPEYLEDHVDHIRCAGRILLFAPLPWIKKRDFRSSLLSPLEVDKDFKFKGSEEPLNLDAESYFGIFTLLAAILEVDNGRRRNLPRRLVRQLESSEVSLFESVRKMLLARFKRVDSREVQAEMDNCDFNSEQQAFIWKWIKVEIDLVYQPLDEEEQEDTTDEYD